MAPQSQPIPPSFFDPTEQTHFAWLGSAGLLINTRGTILMIDPLLSAIVDCGHLCSECGHRLTIDLPIAPDDVPRLDAVLYTHADGDHFGLPTALALEARLTPRFFAPPIIKPKLDTIGVPINRITAVREGESITVGAATIEITPAMHDWQPVDPFRREDCCGYLVRTPDGTIWHPGDSRLIDDLLAVRDVNVLMFDVAQVQTHLGPAGSAELAKTCGATDLIAYHYGTYDVPPGGPFGCDPADCAPYLSSLPSRWHEPTPGQVLPLPMA